MSSTNLAVNPTPNKNQTSRVLRNRWFILGVGVLIASIVLMLTLDMQLYAVSMVAGLLGIALAGYFILRITLRPVQSETMVGPASDIRNGARTYLRRQIRTILLVTPFFAALLYWILDWKVAVTAVWRRPDLFVGILYRYECECADKPADCRYRQ